ncbi:DUF1116 domain-containing protein, partial [Bordetella pertussis]|uniref:DUF1116 domain-containing protein n=1 Tax=Bordetella pertussis TaxID=520 RepID=UPI0021CBABFC
VAEHLRWLNGPFAEQLRAGCEAGIDLVELADQALAAGDDCHGRTLAGTQALAASLRALGHAAGVAARRAARWSLACPARSPCRPSATAPW